MSTAVLRLPDLSGAQSGAPADGDHVEGDAPQTRAEARAAERDAHRPRRAGRRILGWTVLVLAVLALWPAQLGGFTGITLVNGQSMEPTYYTNDVVLSLRQPQYAVGDIVSYLVPDGQDGAGGRVIHRIIAATPAEGGSVYTTQGDGNAEADPWVIRDEDVLGRAVFDVPGIGAGLTPDGAPVVLAIALGAVVTMLLWGGPGDDAPSRRSRRSHGR